MMAAIQAAGNGASVTLLERNEKLGKKLYITGKGRCNLTNNCSLDEFLDSIPHNARFLYSAYAALSPQGLMDFVEKLGVPLQTERGKRVFPVSQKSGDILRALEAACRKAGVEVRLQTRVQGLDAEEGCIRGVRLAEGTALPADAVVVATGGLAYPATGSTGDGYAWAEEYGHRLRDRRPGLVPVLLADNWVPGLMGLSLKNVELLAKRGKKVIYRELGEMMFTANGITGPLALTMSSLCGPSDGGELSVSLDLKPGMDEEEVDARLLKECGLEPLRSVKNMLEKRMPGRLAPVVLQLAKVLGDKPSHQLTRTERARLAGVMKRLPLSFSGTSGYEEAVVTIGGVDVRDIDPKTMGSKIVSGLYFAGEILDVDGLTGGFNLQIAFSTGFVAGRAAAQYA